jgi:cytochrome c oxidase cbb3-type subunit III
MNAGQLRAVLAALAVAGIFVATPAERSDAQIGLFAALNTNTSPLGQSDADAVTSEEPPGPVSPIAPSVQIAPYSGVVPAALLLHVPVSGVVPGDVGVAPQIRNPLAMDPDAAARGMRDFDNFNCSGCHAANGAGGMGPSLSDDMWLYRSSPANIYLTIIQGRQKGMPAFGAMLPDRVVWELVSYIESITEKPNGKFGKTINADQDLPPIEQVSANRITTANPWAYTEPFHNGQKPQ